MKYLQVLLFMLFLFPMNDMKAQQNHYIYIQTENKQPFYLKLDNKQYSSSISGYLIVPKLKDGNYNLTIGFPKSEWPEQNMVCIIADDDKGYLLKNFGDKGWGLFNLQSLDVLMASSNEKKESIEVVNKTDAFSNMLSSVVNDSTIRQTETVKKEMKNTPVEDVEKAQKVEGSVKDSKLDVVETTKEGLKSTNLKDENTNSVLVKEVEKVANAKEGVTIANEARSSVTRSLFNINMEGTEMIYVDDVNGSKDTIRIFIPSDKNEETVVAEKLSTVEKPIEKAFTQEVAVTKEDKATDVRFLEIELPGPDQKPTEKKPVVSEPIEKKVVEKSSVENNSTEKALTEIKKEESKASVEKPVEQTVQRAPMINSDCKNFAMEDDFLKLRKKMVTKEDDDEMVQIARKVFKLKCFTVEQVKNLSVLFLKDSGKYAFFDMAYPFVADSHNFHILQNQLTDTYYINRFQVMVRH